MNKILFFCLLFSSFESYSQEQYFKVVKEYFRVNPYEGSYSGFVNAVITDPELTNIKITKKSQDSLFSVNGDYQKFVPFRFHPRKVEIMLSERTLLSQQALTDTIIGYQISGNFDYSEKNLQYIQKEYNSICKKLNKAFNSKEEVDLNTISGIKAGKAAHYFWTSLTISPITVSWYQKTNSNELVLLIFLRLKYVNNKAIPAISSQDQ